jgi:hypothetical protein
MTDYLVRIRIEPSPIVALLFCRIVPARLEADQTIFTLFPWHASYRNHSGGS